MAHLPVGWESDYDGTRWFYRFTTTGLMQYHFPRPGDEYPELVGLGFGPPDLSLESKLASKHQNEHQSPPHAADSAKAASESDGHGLKKAEPANESGGMSATGYFDPDDFMYFGLNSVSPVGDTSEPTLAELPESERIRSPVGFVAELANNDTAKCAEELAPIELDATQIAPAALQTKVEQTGPAELSAQRSPVEQKQSPEHPVQDTTQHVEEYPLVSASFAYPPLKAATKPTEAVVGNPDSSPQLEQKVLVSQQPTKDYTGENEYETWKPAQGIAKGESTNTNRMSIALSSMSVLQSQNSDLGIVEQKRHSLSGPVDSTIPGVLRPPSGPIVPTPSISPTKVESSPIPDVLQPATAPSKVPSPQDSPQGQPAQNGAPSLPGSGARHESISFGSGPLVMGSNSAHIPLALKPAHDRQSQPPLQTQADDIRPGAHRVSTMPAQPSSHMSLPPKIGGPGIYVFQEIPAAPGPTSGQGVRQDGLSRPHEAVVTQPNSQQFHQPSNQSHSIMNEPLPVVAPLNPRKPTSPNMASSNYGTSNGLNSNAQNSPVSTPVNNPYSEIDQAQGKPSPHPAGSPSQQVNVHQSPQAICPASYQGLMLNYASSQKLIRKPVLPQRPEQVSYNTGTHITGSASIPIRPNHPTLQQGAPSPTASTRPTAVVQAQSHPVPPQANTGSPHGQQIQAHNQRPSISGSPSQIPQHASAPIYSPQNAAQRPPSTSPVQRPPNSQPVAQGTSQISNQNTASGPAAGPVKPQNSPSPMTQPVSPLQSQVSSPTPSIASLHRPPSSASSLSTHTTAQAALGQRPSSAFATHQNHPHVARPTVVPAANVQGNQQAGQSPKPPVAGPPKPFPMLPGQVTPLPSQIGSTSVPMPTLPTPATQAQAQHLQHNTSQVRPPQQNPENQPQPQTAVHRPHQQQPVQANHMPNSGGFTPGQPMPGGVQQGQSRPPAHTAPAQQHTQANMTSPGLYTHQGLGHAGQLPNGQQTVGLTQNVAVQGQPQMANAASPQAQPFFNNQQAGQGQGQGQGYQQYTPSPGAYVSPTYGQTKPFNSAQAAAALSDAGKKMKKWAKKTWQNPTVKQTTVAVGGAIFAESLGGGGMAGAQIANQMYNASQGLSQNNQQRPPGLQHAHTAPPQAQNLAAMAGAFQHVQAVGRPQLQQGMQPIGVQTPGRPPAVQNPGMAGGVMSTSTMQQRPQMRPNMMNQQSPYQVSPPPIGRPPFAQPQQPAAFGQPVYQGSPNQPAFQRPPVQPLYQANPNQPFYQGPPNQPNYQAQGGPDPYAAIGGMLGSAVNALATGGRTNDAPPPSHQQQQQSTPQHEYQPSQHQVVDSEPHHESQPAQHHGGQPEQPHLEQHRSEQPEQHQEGHHEQPYTSQSEQHHEAYAEQNHTVNSEPHEEAYAESHQATHTEQQYTDHTQQQNTVHSEETHQTHSEQHNGAYSEPSQEGNSYYAPPPETTIINNNTTINNVDNSNTAIANATQTNTAYTENAQVMETNNTSAEATAYTDTGYMDTTNANVDSTAFTDATYTGTTYADTAYTDVMNTNTSAEAYAYADTTYVDSSYTDTAYADATYGDMTSVDVSVDVDVNVNMNMDQTMYTGDQTSTMMAEESVSVDVSAYAEVNTADYSGGDWGGGDW
ncbi:hypothetical protein F4818DRAFT_194266 [Hypoxylon cercidicola]|nr:hypothetical protein F4818DRAFT_194266 [Hypoxylon cercidicola]